MGVTHKSLLLPQIKKKKKVIASVYLNFELQGGKKVHFKIKSCKYLFIYIFIS